MTGDLLITELRPGTMYCCKGAAAFMKPLLFNWFRRLALPEKLRKDRIDTLRLKLLKIAVKVVRSARYVFFKLCSHCPFEAEFQETLVNIRCLKPMLE